MIERIVIISLVITGLHIAFQQGNIFSWMRVSIANVLDGVIGKKWSMYVQKPLWACLPCMGGFWAITITRSFDLPMITAVVGLNVIISRIIEQEETAQLEQVKGFEIRGTLEETEFADDVPTLSRQTLKR